MFIFPQYAKNREMIAKWLQLQSRDDVEFYVVVVHSRARAEFEAVSNFVTERIERVGGAETLRAASHAFATGFETLAARFYCYVESHATKRLRLGIHAVNNANDD
jgi:hypothetical protein